MADFSSESVHFIVRAKERRKYIELGSFMKDLSDSDLGDLTLVKDSKVYWYAGVSLMTEKGVKRWKVELVEVPFRLRIARRKEVSDKEFWFISNEFDLSAKEIADVYRCRWDIQVFFRFIKQELNVSHLVSLNENGIEVMLYMTLIVMLILICKRANNLGYKTAKRRETMEIRNLIIAIIVVECGGDSYILVV